MRLKVFMIVPLGMIVLLGTGCSVQCEAVRADSRLMVHGSETVEVRDSVVVATRDTLKEVTTVTVQLDAVGDTVKVSTVTDRTRASVRNRVKEVEVRTEVRVDTVYVERRDSVFISAPAGPSTCSGAARPAWLQGLKWIFWIVIAVTVLIVVIKVGKVFRV